jgi:competence protein ComEA
MLFMKILSIIALSCLSTSVLAAPVEINKADAQMIAKSLNGIGDSKAQLIVEYCKMNSCQKAEDLLNIKGIGQKTLDKIKADLIFSQK